MNFHLKLNTTITTTAVTFTMIFMSAICSADEVSLGQKQNVSLKQVIVDSSASQETLHQEFSRLAASLDESESTAAASTNTQADAQTDAQNNAPVAVRGLASVEN